MVRDDPYVLIVDDDYDSRQLLSALLDMRGIEVREVEDGRQALIAIHERPPGLVVMDMNMPDLDGLTALSRLSIDADKGDIPVLLLTASPFTLDELTKLRTIALDVISKGERSIDDIGNLIEERLSRIPLH